MTVAIIHTALGRRRIDYRVVLLGAILPDLIDKPIGRIFFSDSFHNGRIFAHTLLSVLAVAIVLLFSLRGESARRWFILPVAWSLHLTLDGMWAMPRTLFWPLFGTSFERHLVGSYWWDVLRRPFTHPWTGAQELAGLLILIVFAAAYRLHRGFARRIFVRDGALLSDRELSQ